MIKLESINEDGDMLLQEMEEALRPKLQCAKRLGEDLMNIKVPIEDQPSQEDETKTPVFNEQVDYAKEFWKIYLKNEIEFSLVGLISEKNYQLHELIAEIENIQDTYAKRIKNRNRKKSRRLAIQIEKRFVCPYEKCLKVYGSEVSQNLHIKLKHGGGNKTDREKLAEQICFCQENCLEPPKVMLNLPPGYLKEYKKMYFEHKKEKHIHSH